VTKTYSPCDRCKTRVTRLPPMPVTGRHFRLIFTPQCMKWLVPQKSLLERFLISGPTKFWTCSVTFSVFDSCANNCRFSNFTVFPLQGYNKDIRMLLSQSNPAFLLLPSCVWQTWVPQWPSVNHQGVFNAHIAAFLFAKLRLKCRNLFTTLISKKNLAKVWVYYMWNIFFELKNVQ
jgi:hypothetical protein